MTIQDLLEKNKPTNEVYMATGVRLNKIDENGNLTHGIWFSRQDLPDLKQFGFNSIKEYIIYGYGPLEVKNFYIVDDRFNNGYVIVIEY